MKLQIKKEPEQPTPEATPAPAPAEAAPAPAAPPPGAGASDAVAQAVAQANAQAAADVAAKQAGGGGDGGSDEESEDEAPPPDRIAELTDKALTFATRYWKALTAVVVLAVVGVVTYNIVVKVYYNGLLADGTEAYDSGNYNTAVEKLEEYVAYQPDEAETSFVLLKSHIFNGNYARAEEILNGLSEDALGSAASVYRQEKEFYSVLFLLLGEDKQDAKQRLDDALNRTPDYLPVIYLKAMYDLYVDFNYVQVEQALDKGLDIIDTLNDEQLDDAIEKLFFSRAAFYFGFSAVVGEAFPLPFSELKDAPVLSANDDLGRVVLRLPSESFYNFYYVPTNRPSLIDDTLTVEEDMALLRVASAIRQGDAEKVADYMDRLSGAGLTSRYYLYLSAFVAAQQGDYEKAIRHYDDLALDGKGTADEGDYILMRVAAQWASNEGEAPTEEMIAALDQVLDLQPNSVAALVNRSYFHLYQGKADEPHALLSQAKELSSNSFYVLYNQALLDAANKQWETAASTLTNLRFGGFESKTLASALAYVLFASGDYEPAIEALAELGDDEVSPGVYVVLSNIYRIQNRPLLVISTLEKGRKLFPADRTLLFDLMLEYAIQKETEKYASLKRIVTEKDLRENYHALLSEGLVSTDRKVIENSFNEALNRSKTDNQRQEVLLRWLRRLIDLNEADAALVAADNISRAYSGKDVPLDLTILQMWAQAASGGSEVRRALAGRAIRLLDTEVDNMDNEMKTDVGYLLLAVNDSRYAASLLEPIAETQATERMMRALLLAYQDLNEDEKATAINNRLKAIESQRSSSDLDEARRSAEKLRQSGVVFARNGEVALDAASDGSDVTEEINQALLNKNYEKAIAIYTNELSLDPDLQIFTPAIVHQNRGVLYLKSKNYEAAVEDFQKAIQFGLSKEDSANVLYNYSLALINLKDYKQAKEVLDKLLDIYPDNIRNLVLYARLLGALKYDKELQAVYEKLIGMSPEHIDFYIGLASLHWKQKRSDEALKVFNTALSIAPRHPRLHHELAQYYAAHGNLQKAREHLDIAQGLDN